ncbi:MAG: 5'/3'-nucleotidase SurE [Phenylobacterium sp. RIFCSPHIGHO2_01_FULL_69_31]|uniref:5'/3'-nucleotidase SurE n=1 Tax=Phenylobacterium sp. RIFCSPHIGHO2_01_FULL_69_31 TaxID=1801944 RepID=UPI0008BCAABB|nr:5'/3'-nucleotidase SurE [Phenylobacterium sp. RIFCSPHIGHO2_01_FULL_69_31]OHB27848.1 MAG: 5'/3'-nucleotidase SurE [Phenylobacterium sp. RIFCSPHIGHO2_01_FULL_69_31]
MRILITNDDGIHADGLEALERIAARLSDDVWVVAPEYEQSGASRALTLADPIRVRQLSERRFATTGTPTDCVMLGINDLVPGGRPDLVLSGVNRGANLAEDVTMSGTVAGAIEGMALGVPSIALSQMGFYEPGQSFEAAETFGPGIIKRLVELGWPNDVVLNINFPNGAVENIKEVEVTRQGFRDFQVRHAEKRLDLRGRDYYWVGFRQERSSPPEGTDLRALYDGKISVTPLHIDLTHTATVHELKGQLGGVPPKA